MKSSSLFAAAVALVVALVVPCSAQYFSDGWKPGQPVPSATPSPVFFDPANPPSPPSQSTPKSTPFSFTSLFSSGPVADLLGRAGINVTQSLQAFQNASSQSLWDERIPLIHDDNYEDVIVNEELTEQEEKDRVWFLCITVTAAQPSGLSSFVDSQFDEAYNITQLENDMPNVRWGRIDYINVTEITTRWGVWQAPMLVVLTDRGQTLRFYRAAKLQIKAESLRQFIKGQYYLKTAPWQSSFGPGGKREFVLRYFAIVLRKIYDVTSTLPRWVLYIVTGSVGSVVVNLLHSRTAQNQAKSQQQAQTTAPTPGPSPAASTSAASGASPAKGNKPAARNRGKKGKN